MRFNFAAVALCQMLIEPAFEQWPEEVTAELLGFYANEEDAQLEMECIIKGREIEHDERCKKFRYLGWTPFVPPVFQVVPIKDMEFRWLSDAEGMIEQAAVLQYRGCSVAVSA